MAGWAACLTCHVFRHPVGIFVHHWFLAVDVMVAVAEHHAGKAEDQEIERAHEVQLARGFGMVGLCNG